jgi:hypothetical protein
VSSAGLERKNSESGEDRGFAEGEEADEKTKGNNGQTDSGVYVYPTGESV